MVAAFRVRLKSYKGIKARSNTEAGREEITDLLTPGFPVYAVEDNVTLVGYTVLPF